MGSANTYSLILNLLTFVVPAVPTFCCGYPYSGYPAYGYPSPYYPVTYPTEYVRIPIYAIVRSGSGSPSYPSYPSQYTTPDTNSDSYAFPEMNSHNYRPSDEILSNYAAPPKHTRPRIDHSSINPDSEEAFKSLPSNPQEEASGSFSTSEANSGIASMNSGDASHSSKPYEFNPEDNSARWRRMRWH